MTSYPPIEESVVPTYALVSNIVIFILSSIIDIYLQLFIILLNNVFYYAFLIIKGFYMLFVILIV